MPPRLTLTSPSSSSDTIILQKRVPTPALLASLFAFLNHIKTDFPSHARTSRDHELRSLSRGRRDEWCSPGSSDAATRRQKLRRRRHRSSVNSLQRAAQPPPPPWGCSHRQERAQQVVRVWSRRDRWMGGFRRGTRHRMFRENVEQFFSLVFFRFEKKCPEAPAPSLNLLAPCLVPSPLPTLRTQGQPRRI